LENELLSICYNYSEFQKAAMTFSHPEDSNLSARLTKALTPEQARMLRYVAREASRLRLPLYIVGGFVRDLLLDHPSLDIDLVVEGDAIEVAQAVVAKHGGKVRIHARFKTAQWFPPAKQVWPEFVDFTSTRSETYKQPAALPIVHLGTLTDDLLRRDFSINTLALRLDGNHFGDLCDVLGGLEDLRAGVVRVLHPASFDDDPTRLFRAIRYEQRYDFQIAPETLRLVPEALPLIENLSADRIRHELDLVLEEEKAPCMLERLAGLGILRAVHPGLKWNDAKRERFEKGIVSAQTLEIPFPHPGLAWTLWLMDVPLPGLESIDRRLHFKSGVRELLRTASTLFAKVHDLTEQQPSQWVALLDEFPFKAVQGVFLVLPTGAPQKALQNYLALWRHVKAKTTGHDLKRYGLQPGPAYQVILKRIRAARLDGEINTPAEELDLLGKLTNKE
jgi:tRNA nucleotidyltransferase (CCA-adding enzyme)